MFDDDPPARMFIAVGELVDGKISLFQQPLLVADPGPAKPEASPLPVIEMVEFGGVWMTREDARAEAIALQHARMVAAPFNGRRW